MPTDRFALLTDAAIDVLAEEGMRGLTHRAVDRRTGLPEGTTSAYFRTRKQLIEAVVRRIADLDREDLRAGRLPADGDGPPPDLTDVPAMAAGIAAVLDHWMSGGRNRTLARYACLLEATHHPEIRTILAYGDASRAQSRAMLAAAGAPNPDQAGDHFVACIDGLLFDRLAGAGARTAPPPGTAANRADLTAALTAVLRGFLG
ncbi:TetR family transcriptional regulator [Actinoplanes italicus]|uniref:TetR family transcriptional regulator n=1 Tax=Actinoplanes italicus TaxID=113567 RepID=A0A2T0K0P4_9ACTN|nr:TetR/AcrR family transcriptional regulator [Actinoplanes italicus]PRX16357.1 TetR family transcriptional regulator [Actinoplanes italicus]GIE34434.1 TetR family transcriptional regulator [Actinoplanes italicus]